MINDTMAPAILTAHDAAVSQLDGFRTAFEVCGMPDVPSAESSVKGVTTKGIADKLEEHRQCRAKQDTAKGIADKCNSDLGKEETVQKAACDAVPGSDGTPPLLDKDKHVGCKVTPDDYEGWVNSFESQIDQLKKQYDEAAGGCGNASKIVGDMKPKCQAADGAVTGNKTACDALQAAADSMGCAANPTAHASCKTYTDCYDAAEKNYLDANESIAAAQVNRTSQWRVLKRMQCLLSVEATGATHDGIDDCREATVDTSHLDLVYPAVPDKHDCSHIVGGPLPCTDEWTAMYGDLPVNAPASPCTACPAGALLVCSQTITATIVSTAEALCVPSSGGQIEYTGRTCNDNSILWTSSRTIDRRLGLSEAACSWSWDSNDLYGGSCGVAPTVDGGASLPTTCHVLPSPYVLGADGSADCPSGAKILSSPSECRAAAEMEGTAFFAFGYANRRYPVGCSMRGQILDPSELNVGRFFFNPPFRGVWGGMKGQRPLCKVPNAGKY